MYNVESVQAIVATYGAVCKRTRRVAEGILDEHLERHLVPGRYTPGDVLRHLAAAERWMWAENIQFRPSRYPGHGTDLAEGKDAVLAYLRRMQEETADVIRNLPVEHLSRTCKTVGGEIEVGHWLRLMLEHHVHHRGQLYEILGSLGAETPPIYGLTEPEVKARSVADG